jgi:hypothetical protein
MLSYTFILLGFLLYFFHLSCFGIGEYVNLFNIPTYSLYKLLQTSDLCLGLISLVCKVEDDLLQCAIKDLKGSHLCFNFKKLFLSDLLY